jgi:mannose-1-phosphate guanylyltransferase/mannose-6-phosphate isomerase
LFQQAITRINAIGNAQIDLGLTLIVTNEEHRFLASEQLREVGIELGTALLEPVGRNTAPALTLAALAAPPGRPTSAVAASSNATVTAHGNHARDDARRRALCS